MGGFAGKPAATPSHGKASFFVPGTYSFTVPAPTLNFKAVAGGGGANSVAGGGGGNSYTGRLTGLIVGQVITVTIGAGGAGNSMNTAATAGGITSFGSTFSLTGGGGATSAGGTAGGSNATAGKLASIIGTGTSEARGGNGGHGGRSSFAPGGTGGTAVSASSAVSTLGQDGVLGSGGGASPGYTTTPLGAKGGDGFMEIDW